MAFLSLILLGGISQSGGNIVLPVQGSTQDIENARVAFVLALAGIMMFWRFLLRIVLATVAVAVGVGAFVLLQGMHH
jgi:hypothetical protein